MSGPFGSTAWMANPSSGFYDHQIDNSVRFETASNGHLTHTLGTAANLRTNTTSFWLKRSKLGVSTRIFASGASLNSNFDNSINIIITSGDLLQLYQETGNNNTVINLITTQVFRDTSAWYHIVFAIDTTQGTNTNRVKLYVNGIQVTSFGTATYPSENLDTHIFSAEIRRWARGQSSAYADVQLAQIAQISGVQHAISDLGELKNDIWIPKDITGLTYAAGSYLLELKNSGVGTASSSTVGADTSGNTLHFTSSGLAVHDHLPDSPTNNFATLNPLDSVTTSGHSFTLSEGNTKFILDQNASYADIVGTMQVGPGGKWYWEQYNTITGSNNNALPSTSLVLSSQSAHQPATIPTGSIDLVVGTRDGSEEVYMIAVDLDNGYAYRGNEGSWSNGANLNDIVSGEGTGATATGISSTEPWRPFIELLYDGASAVAHMNFGQDSTFAGTVSAGTSTDSNGKGNFKYAPPAGFLALCTANLPDPVETFDPAKGGSPQDYFNSVLYTGNGGTLGVTGVGFQPDLVWIKDRGIVDGNTYNHVWYDSVRGALQQIRSDATQESREQAGSLTAFGSDGFSLGSHAGQNTNNEKHVAWNWKAGTAFSNDASATSVGSLDSAGTVSTDVGFSIITYTGNGTSGATIAHGLDSAPQLTLHKNLITDGKNWESYFINPFDGSYDYFYLNLAVAKGDFSGGTVPSSSIITLGGGADSNENAKLHIAYCFHSVEGYSKFGGYTGNGSADGTFIYTGFRPAWVMTKRIDGSDWWAIIDTARDVHNAATLGLRANDPAAESSDEAWTKDLLSNGFKQRSTNGGSNADNAKYIYLAFAEQPFKYSNAR